MDQDLPFEQTIGGLPEDDNTPETPDYAAQIADLRAKMEAAETRHQQERLMWQTALMRPNPEPEPPQLPSFDDLPDPVENPEEFRKTLSQRMTQSFAQQQEAVTRRLETSTSQKQDLDNLWSRFKSEYEDLAGREALVQGAAALEVQKLRAQGIQDPHQAIMADQDGFLSRVAARMKAELGEDVKPNRTQGVGGGSRTVVKPEKEDKPAPKFVDQLKAVQLQNGLI